MPDVSVILEMDNARRSGIDASRRTLAELARQIAAEPRRFEVVIVHDPTAMPRAAVDEVIEGAGLRRPANVEEVRVVAAPPGRRYYELKNLGAEHARGDVLLFTDADTTPEPGFVARLLSALDDPDVEVVTGSAYMSPTRTLLQKTVALVQQFDVRDDDDRLRPSRDFYAHSLTVRREVFRAHPFRPDVRLRGACQELRRELAASGIRAWQHPGARVRHAPPAGWGDALRRAIWDGHDLCWERRRKGEPMAGPARAARGLVASVGQSWRRIEAGRVKVGARRIELPAILALAVARQVAVRAGYLVTRVAPSAIPTLLPR